MTVFVCYNRYYDDKYNSVPLRVFLTEQEAKLWIAEEVLEFTRAVNYTPDYVEIEIG